MDAEEKVRSCCQLVAAVASTPWHERRAAQLLAALAPEIGEFRQRRGPSPRVLLALDVSGALRLVATRHQLSRNSAVVAVAHEDELSTIGDRRVLSRGQHVSYLLVATPDLRERLLSAGWGREQVRVVSGLWAPEEDTREEILSILRDAASRRPRTMLAKRSLDIVGSLAGLAIALVPMLVVAGFVRARLGTPVIFRQVRPGRDGRPFSVLKFRTMTDARDSSGDPLPDSQRLTPFGRALRRTSLDELPELLNVLRGEMSLVGPRPLLERYSEWYSREERLRLKVRPGITGLAQVNGRNLLAWDQRLALDVEYSQTITFARDLGILATTIRNVLSSDGIVVDPGSAMQDLDVERGGQVAGE